MQSRARIEPEEPSVQASAALSDVLKRIDKIDRPAVLDLGPMCGQTATLLAQKGSRIHVDRFEPPPPTPPRKPGEKVEEPAPLAIDQPDGAFDIVLAWENIDFVPPERLADFGRELHRILKPAGVLLLFSLSRSIPEPEPIPSYRLFEDGSFSRETGALPLRRRWVHANREIERSLPDLVICSMHLLRNQMREILVVKKA
jgi:SAM-dependent methyltransferase